MNNNISSIEEQLTSQGKRSFKTLIKRVYCFLSTLSLVIVVIFTIFVMYHPRNNKYDNRPVDDTNTLPFHNGIFLLVTDGKSLPGYYILRDSISQIEVNAVDNVKNNFRINWSSANSYELIFLNANDPLKVYHYGDTIKVKILACGDNFYTGISRTPSKDIEFTIYKIPNSDFILRPNQSHPTKNTGR